MTPRLDRYGDPLEGDDDMAETLPAPPRRKPERKGRPIGGLPAITAELGGKCPKCELFICGCCRVCGGRVRPGWTIHPACDRGQA